MNFSLSKPSFISQEDFKAEVLFQTNTAVDTQTAVFSVCDAIWTPEAFEGSWKPVGRAGEKIQHSDFCYSEKALMGQTEV